ncbi:MAG: hypothetical protein AB1649_27445, partial [Chloroflexota bacterium]
SNLICTALQEVNMSGLLSVDNQKRLEAIRQHVRNLWHVNPGPPWYTFHDASHNQAIENTLYLLIPAEKRQMLSDNEWFLLLAAAWLHDVGMMLKFGAPDESIGSIREKHHERSARYTRTNRDVLGLEHHEAILIAEICRFHRKSLSILDCEETVGEIRLRLLAAYLRLADALHVDTTRSTTAMYQLLVAAGMPWESRIHWLKSFWIHSVRPDPEDLIIHVDLIETDPKSARMEFLADLVENEIREELDSVRDVLIRGRISSFLDVNTRVVKIEGDEPSIELDLVLSNLEQENISSASEVADSIVDTIIRLTDFGSEAYRIIREYHQQLDKLLEKRSCHVLIKNLLSNIEHATQQEDLDTETRKKVIDQIRAQLISFKEMRRRSVALLAANAQPFLSDGSSILLFGYSSLVLAALECLPAQAKESTRIYIAEGRGKTQYNHRNELIYCDGMRYAIHCRKAGFSDVMIIPDVCAASLMFRGIIGKVVFGANGIDPNGDFGHTAGHLALADSAIQHNVPVYVIADTAKFGKTPWNPELERDNQWLTRDPKSLKELQRHNIKTLNPREDRVSQTYVNMLITEIGAFPPTKIPDALRK